MAEVEAMMTRARTDPETARHLLVLFTHRCRSLIGFEDQRAFLFGAGIPAAFLPTAAKLGRLDLIRAASAPDGRGGRFIDGRS